MSDPSSPLLLSTTSDLVGEDDRPTAERLSQVVRDRPDVADDAVDVVVALVCEARLDGPASPCEDGSESAAVDRALGGFRRALGGRLPPPPNPFAQRSPRALRDIAHQVGLDKTLVAKLRDRRIRAATVPARVRRSLARALAITEEALVRHLQAPALLDPAMQFKARQAPRLGEKETFPVAVARSGLTEDARRRLTEDSCPVR